MKIANRTFILLALLVFFMTACDTAIPSPPAVTVVVTVVDDQQALDDGINQAISGTQQAALAATATILAQGGVTYTPSPTLTPSSTPTATPTRIVTATRTPLPSDTPTATFAPFATSTPPPQDAEAPSWVRVLHAWRSVGGQAVNTTTVDVYINESRISRALEFGSQSTYLQVQPGQANVSIRTVDSHLTTPIAPLLNTVVSIAPGETLSLVMLDMGRGLTLMPVQEDLTPLPSGLSRVTIVQGNPELLPSTILIPSIQRNLASNLLSGQVVGPYEVPSDTYIADLYDVANAGTPLESLPRLNLAARLNYVLVLTPFRGEGQKFTDLLAFAGSTRLIETDVNGRFIHFASGTGSLSVTLDNQQMFNDLTLGSISDAVPVSSLGSRLILASGDTPVYTGILGPWTDESEANSDKLFLITDADSANANQPVTVVTLSQNPPRSAINASIRLIHALPGGVPFSLEVRRVTPDDAETENAWIPIVQASAGSASTYAARTPDTFDVRVVQATSRTPLAVMPNVQMLPGGVYDFVVLAGTETGSARLELIQPNVQITNLATSAGDPTVIEEAVEATLRVLAPTITATPTVVNTPTHTPTPIPTNTPRPTNTASVALPVLSVKPAPPDTTSGTFILEGLYFSPNQRYVVQLDGRLNSIAQGRVSEDGTIEIEVTLPLDVAPGTHTISVCVDCRPIGLNQAAYTALLVANPAVTPTPTPQP